MFDFLKFFKKKKKGEENKTSEEVKDQKVEDESILKEIAAQKGEKEATPEPEEEELSPREKEKLSRLNKVKSKIAQMLQSNNVEIVDENEGDDYEYEVGSVADKKKQEQDYDALKAKFGQSGKNKKEELTLTIDDFDYTYIGKYIDEYDIIHMKDIKRIKLPNKHKKLIKRLTIASVAIVFIVVASVVTYNIVKTKPECLNRVYLSQPNQTYFENEYFDYTGIYMVAEYSTGRVAYYPLKSDNYVESSGGYVEEHGMKSGELLKLSGSGTILTFHFDGFVGENSTAETSLNMNITIVKKRPDGLCTIYSDGIFDLKANDLITSKHLIPLVEYQDYNDKKVSSTRINISNVKIYVDNEDIGYDSVNKGFVLTKDITPTSIIKVTYEISSNEIVEVILDRTKNEVSSKLAG